jgi:glycosyltransferase involved in cell wall biosynthesis
LDSLILSLDPDFPGGVITMQEAMRQAHLTLGLTPHLGFSRLGQDRWDPSLRHEQRNGRSLLSTGFLPSIEYLNYLWPAARLRPELHRFSVIQIVSGFNSASLIPILAGRPFVSWIATPFIDEIVARNGGQRPSRSIRINYALRGVNQAIERWTFGRAAAVMALSDYTARRLREEAGVAPERLSVLRCPVDVDLYRPEGPRWEAGPRRYLLAVGRVDDPRKNMLSTARVFAGLARDFPDLDLVILGKIEQAENEVTRFVKSQGLAERVHFPGHRSGDELAAIYRSAEAFVMTSRQEGLGIVVMEAQSSGVPVVVMRCGGSDELIDQAGPRDGWLVDQGDEDSFGRIVRQLAGDGELRARVGAAARAKARREFSADMFARRLADIYAQVFPSPHWSSAPVAVSNQIRLNSGAEV